MLDASCGIGTQAIGLAELGYRVTASDVSRGAINRAKEEAERRKLRIEFSVADLRTLSAQHEKQFDLVISCDNSVPHLLSDDDIRKAFSEMGVRLRSGGGCIISVRDYADAPWEGSRLIPYGVREEAGRRFVVFQVQDFHGPLYDAHMYLIEDRGDDCTVQVMRTTYYAIRIERLLQFMGEAGFEGVTRIDGSFFQPLLIGTKAA